MGYKKLKPPQMKAIKAFVEDKNDVFVCLPTGIGKFVCHGILPLIFDSLCHPHNDSLLDTDETELSLVIVVSPLKALMMDQVESFQKRGLCAVSEDVETKLVVMEGGVQLVYISIETLLRDHQWRAILDSPVIQGNLVWLVIDEAHCVKKWYAVVMYKCTCFNLLVFSLFIGPSSFEKHFQSLRK